MVTANCGCCRPEVKRICKVIGWIGMVAAINFCGVFSYRLNQNIGIFESSLSFLIISVCYFIGSISLLLAINAANKLYFLPWAVFNLVAIVLLLVGAFIWEMYYNLIVVAVLLYAQSFVVKYIVDRFMVKQEINQLNV